MFNNNLKFLMFIFNLYLLIKNARAEAGLRGHEGVLCQGQAAENFCDCDGDCGGSFCLCAQAQAKACCNTAITRQLQTGPGYPPPGTPSIQNNF